MGEIADMMLDGDICEGCGVPNLGESYGVPWRCASCRRDERAARHQETLARQQLTKKVPCPTCGKRVKAVGLADHQRDAHGEVRNG